jgi:tagatose-1,6-bisphosphate aldolase
VTVQELVAAKVDILKTLVNMASGVLVDVKTGLPAYQLVDKAQNKPLVLAIEKSGYVEKEGERLTELAYTVSQLKKLGAQAIKLLIYFNLLL